MDIGDPKITALRAKVQAAHEEFETAMACHEAWKPAAYDTELHKRIGRSYAANTFRLVRQALRRETLLALLRLWDNNLKAVGMTFIADTLGDARVLDALAAECAAHWGNLPMSGLQDLSGTEQATVTEAAHRSENKFGVAQGDALRRRAEVAIQIIGDYAEGGANHPVLKRLKVWRNEHQAHQQVIPIGLSADLIDGVDDPGIAGQGGEPPGLVT